MINAKLDHMYGDDWEKLNWEKFRAVWPLDTPEEKPKTCPWYGERPVRLSYEEANEIAASGAKLEVVPLRGMMATKMQDDPRKHWEYGTRIDPIDMQQGTAVQIAVPDMALMYIDEVCVETDFCTDALQSMLDDGWRILAVCPPNSQRRPDYILGRRKHKDPFTYDR